VKILLLYPKWTINYGLAGYFAKKASVWPPLNLAYLAAVAEEEGHKAKIIDGQVENLSVEEMLARAADFSPDLIGVTVTTPFSHIVSELAASLKRRFPQTPLVVGGPHITMLKEKAFLPSFDYAFVGEAERSWAEFLRGFENGTDITDVPGILYRKGEKILFTGDPEPNQDIDSIPYPARHLLRTHDYKIGTLRGTKNFATIMTTRGCPFKCIFCSTEVFGSRVRKRSPRAVVDEMISTIREFNINHFIFLDDTLTLDKAHIMEICRLIREEGLEVTLDGSTRANLIDEELIAALAESERICKYVDIPLQHVNRDILKYMGRSYGKEDTEDLIRRIRSRKRRISLRTTLMVGFPGETEQMFDELYDFVKMARFDHLGVFVYSREAGTAAARLALGVGREEAEERKDKIMSLQAGISEEVNKQMLNQTVPVLIEGLSPETDLLLEGRTATMAPEVDGRVLINKGDAAEGEIVPVLIKEVYPYDLVGEIVRSH